MLENLLNLEPGSPLNPAILSLFIELRMISKCFESFKSKFSGRKLQIESFNQKTMKSISFTRFWRLFIDRRPIEIVFGRLSAPMDH